MEIMAVYKITIRKITPNTCVCELYEKIAEQNVRQ